MSKHNRTINWDALTRVIMVVISYLGTMSAGCYIAGLVEHGIDRCGVAGLGLSLVLVITSLLGLAKRESE